jgi:hypothetical protein
MRVLWVALVSLVIASTPAREPYSTRPYTQTAMKLMGLCDWWLAWGDKQEEPASPVQAWQWDYTCRRYHVAEI